MNTSKTVNRHWVINNNTTIPGLTSYSPTFNYVAADVDAGAPEFLALRAKGEAHPIEAVGRTLRKLFSWIKNSDDYQEGNAAR